MELNPKALVIARKLGIDVVIASTQVYAADGYPTIMIPVDTSKAGEPQVLMLIGKHLGNPDLLALGYAIEQATHARKTPNLDATLATFKPLNHAPATNL